ncbi:hypothetical protein PPL_04399 [Heterostelium album PN500]|uniref:Uncharacterized protein n=1 Tax=Heterostelium pallidum (strain ATCC 26659 / Pp 5 / PN500) TaxID=670386 RepID=D3B7G1_HETP5|nr:hypothetical protein PPL_04399 [Heterostelium album PN500]EFA82704.1 hypothetical protein PPL_04399 [Heterostelium album PN500]|eukprot:XP_020434821.1 hypothetical protein PPL_04399 [Heterostelium album PN500]
MAYEQEALENMLYKQVADICKTLGIKVKSTKAYLIKEIMAHQGDATSPDTTAKKVAAPAPKKNQANPKRKAYEPDSDEEKEEEEEKKEEEKDGADLPEKAEEEEEPVQPTKRTRTATGKAIPVAAPKKPVAKKEESESEVEEEEEEEEEPTTTTTTTSNVSKVTKAIAKSTQPLGKWTIHKDEAYFFLEQHISRSKIAAFDMDDTMVEPKSGAKFAKSRTDWQWWNPVVPTMMKQLHDDGYQVIVITNQGGIGVKVQFDLANSFYVGDAAGRPDGWKPGKKKDFAASDKGFAMASNIDFKTPEEFFLKEAPTTAINSKFVVPKATTSGPELQGDDQTVVSKTQELVIMVGWPASGKSTFTKKHFIAAGYAWANQDTLKVKAKVQKFAEEQLSQGKSVVIDNTNPTKAARKEYINIAKRHGVQVRCFHMQTDRETSYHNNYHRERTLDVKHVPTMVYHMYNKNFEAPELSEGFKEIKKVNFVLALDPKHESSYKIPVPNTAISGT